jgi:hypothetical protein
MYYTVLMSWVYLGFVPGLLKKLLNSKTEPQYYKSDLTGEDSTDRTQKTKE